MRPALIILAVALLVTGSLGEPAARAPQSPSPSGLSPFERAKAEALLRDRLPCLGCHRLGDDGGRIGPDLTSVGARRSAEEIAALIRDPQGIVPGVVMPPVPMPEAWRGLIVAYLAERVTDAGARSAPLPRPPEATSRVEPAATLYARYCAACHGAQGRGDGANAEYLPVRPTVHADRAHMATRSDDALFDAIFAGGYVVGRSPRMPPFGQLLTRDEIRALVRHLRALCGCEGPGWSRDGRATP